MVIERIYTDYPLLDELVYAAKIMMTDCILKDQEVADSYETLDTIRDADIYISIIENRVKFEYFNYTYEQLSKAGVPTSIIPQCIIDRNKIPSQYRDKLLSNTSEEFLENYREPNPYYRTLNGQPNLDLGDKFVYLTEDDIKDISIDIDISVPLHKISDANLQLLDSLGILKKIEERYPNYKYLRYISKRKISIYNARKARKFDTLYVATPDNASLKNRFMELLEISRNYTMKTIYMEAYKFQSDNYDKFMIVFIILQAVIDFLAELPEYYIRRDIFDLRTIQYFFESNGVDYFPDIPIKYQISLVQNLNKLIKYSGTNKVIIEIASLFGFDNIEIFAYYMLKERKTDSLGNYIFETKPDPDGDGAIPDNSKNYDLKFIKVPLGESIDDYIKNTNNHYDYSYLTASDKYWNGEFSKDAIKEQILEHEFNIIRTKYLSIDAIVELTDLTFQIPYFVNMIMFSDINKDELKIRISQISNDPILISDAFILLYALMYEYYGLEDAIIDTPTKYLTIKGFNFDVNMGELATYVQSKGFTLKELGVSNFQIPKNGILTFSQLVEIYCTNRDICNHIIEQMQNANNKKIYDIYKYLYEALMFTNASYDYYYIESLGRMASTYTEFIQYKNSSLYDYLDLIKSESDERAKEQKITSAISLITSTIQDYLNTTELNNIFANIPTLSIDYLKTYMFKVINFFKSYKIDLTTASNIYKFADKYENKVFVTDDSSISYYYIWDDYMNIRDKSKLSVTFNKEDEFMIQEMANILRFLNIQYDKNDIVNIRDKFNMVCNLLKIDKNYISDTYSYISVLTHGDRVVSIDKTSLLAHLDHKDEVVIEDGADIQYY